MPITLTAFNLRSTYSQPLLFVSLFRNCTAFPRCYLAAISCPVFGWMGIVVFLAGVGSVGNVAKVSIVAPLSLLANKFVPMLGISLLFRLRLRWTLRTYLCTNFSFGNVVPLLARLPGHESAIILRLFSLLTLGPWRGHWA